MRSFIAGQSTTGARVASSVVVRRSSARPWAARASRSAVAGATTITSASRPSRMWSAAPSALNRSVQTGRPVHALEGERAHELLGRGGEDDVDLRARGASESRATWTTCTRRSRP
jgi:hypothetical protein